MIQKQDIPIIPYDRVDDLYNLEIAGSSDLVLFMAGNQFMVMEELISVFQEKYPEVKSIFYETLPPGLELKQILYGGAFFRDKKIDVYPDIYTSVNESSMKILERSGYIKNNDYYLYLHNRLALIVPEGNPANIKSVIDMGKDDVRISQPNPDNEDIAFHIIEMYRQAGGDNLVYRIMEEKLTQGTTILTIVHHRETPLHISKKTVDIGPVWNTEALYARLCGFAFDIIEPGEKLDQRDKINYYICKLSNAPHCENAQKFLDFTISSSAQQIYKKYGFLPHYN